jgi:hypothetical protein
VSLVAIVMLISFLGHGQAETKQFDLKPSGHIERHSLQKPLDEYWIWWHDEEIDNVLADGVSNDTFAVWFPGTLEEVGYIMEVFRLSFYFETSGPAAFYIWEAGPDCPSGGVCPSEGQIHGKVLGDILAGPILQTTYENDIIDVSFTEWIGGSVFTGANSFLMGYVKQTEGEYPDNVPHILGDNIAVQGGEGTHSWFCGPTTNHGWQHYHPDIEYMVWAHVDVVDYDPDPFLVSPSNDFRLFGDAAIVYEDFVTVTAVNLNYCPGITSTVFEYSTDGISWLPLGEDSVDDPRGFWSVNWDVSSLSSGSYTLKATMSEYFGGTGSTELEVFRTEAPPICEIRKDEIIEPIGGLYTFQVFSQGNPQSELELSYFSSTPSEDLSETGTPGNVDQTEIGGSNIGEVEVDCHENTFGAGYGNMHCSSASVANAIWYWAQRDRRLIEISDQNWEEYEGEFQEYLTDLRVTRNTLREAILNKYREDCNTANWGTDDWNFLTNQIHEYLDDILPVPELEGTFYTEEEGKKYLTNRGLGVVLAYCKIKSEIDRMTESSQVADGWEKFLEQQGLSDEYTGVTVGTTYDFFTEELEKHESISVLINEVVNGQPDPNTGHYVTGKDYSSPSGTEDAKAAVSFIDPGTGETMEGEVDSDNPLEFTSEGKKYRVIWMGTVSPTDDLRQRLEDKTFSYLGSDPEGEEGFWDVEWNTSGVEDGFYVVRATLTDSTQDVIVCAQDHGIFYVDNTVPDTPQGFQGTSSPGYITLVWDRVPALDITLYSVYRDTVQGFSPDSTNILGYVSHDFSGTENDITYDDTDILPFNTYYYRVSALDFAGNRSSPSEEIEVTALSCGVKGDVDNNTTINVLDVLKVVNFILRLQDYTVCEGWRADCTNDGQINILDALAIINVILGLVPECPSGSFTCKPLMTYEVMEFLKSLESYLSPEDFTRFMTLVKSVNILPSAFALNQNYPNPFNPETSIEYALPENGKVRLAVYNILGQEVKVLIDGRMEAGYHTVTFDGTDLSSGVYFYRLEAVDFIMTRKMVLLK